MTDHINMNMLNDESLTKPDTSKLLLTSPEMNKVCEAQLKHQPCLYTP